MCQNEYLWRRGLTFYQTSIFLDRSKRKKKTFADDKKKCCLKTKFVPRKVENIVGKGENIVRNHRGSLTGENAGHHNFFKGPLTLPQTNSCFLRVCCTSRLKTLKVPIAAN